MCGRGGRGGDGSEWGSIKDVDGEMMAATHKLEEEKGKVHNLEDLAASLATGCPRENA